MAKNDTKAADEAAQLEEERLQSQPKVPATNEAEYDEPIDPRTNQPVSDFFPKGLSKEDEEAVRLQQATLSTGDGNARAAVAAQLLEHRRTLPDRTKEHDELVKTVKKDTEDMFKSVTMVDPATYRARAHALVLAEAAANTKSTTVPGGCYQVAGHWVNANGEEVDAPDDAD